jgi:hypothetical protein
MHSISLPGAALAALVVVAASAASAAASPAAAQIAPGSTLVFGGTADATDIGSDGVLLAFIGQATVDAAASSGAFAPVGAAAQPAAVAIAPLEVGSGPQPIERWLQVGGYTFALASLPSGAYGQDDCYVAPAVGQRCTPYQFPSYELSPFYLENRAAAGSDAMFTALVSFDVIGTVTGHGSSSAFVGTFTATFEGLSYQEALAGLEHAGLRGVPFTGRLVAVAGTSVTPEPSTALLVASGLAGVGLAARRRRRRVRMA